MKTPISRYSARANSADSSAYFWFLKKGEGMLLVCFYLRLFRMIAAAAAMMIMVATAMAM